MFYDPKAVGLPTSRWVAVNTHPHRERFAMENLERQQFVAYCPMVRKRLRHARRVYEGLRPLFPGYVFVEVNPSLQQWRSLLSTYGVRSVVRCGEQLSFVEGAFIDSLKSREVDGAIIRPANPYQVGQQVRMTGSALDGLVATIIEMNEKDRLVVLLDLLNRPVRVTLDASAVTAA